jgi:hypothetical protein
MNESTFAAAGARSHFEDQQLIPPNDSGLRPAVALYGGQAMELLGILIVMVVCMYLLARGAYR